MADGAQLLGEAVSGQRVPSRGTMLGAGMSAAMNDLNDTNDMTVAPNQTENPQSESDRLRAEYERKVAINRMQSERLLQRASTEKKVLGANRVKVVNKWRQYLREMKHEELVQQIEMISSSNDRSVDHQIFKLKNLNNDIDALNDELLVLERSHFRRMGQLTDIERERMMELQSEFVRDLEILKREFNAEKEYILRSFWAQRTASESAMASIESREVREEHETKQMEETLCEELRNKNLEELNVVKISLEAEIEEYEKQFDETHDRYIESTEDKNRQFGELKVKDTALSLEIETLMKRIQVLLQQLAFWRKKMASNDRECRARNDTLRTNKSGLMQQYRSLKLKMSRFRKSQNDRLSNVVASARNSNQINTDILSIGKRILFLNAIASKLQTEKEKLLPFGRGQTQALRQNAKPLDLNENQNVEKEQELESDPINGTTTDTMAAATMSGLNNIGDGHPELTHFVQKYNAVLLDTTCFQQKRKSLAEDNKKLRAVLKAYLDGITVSNHTINEPNTLFVLNHNTKIQQNTNSNPNSQQRRRGNNKCVVEGNQVVNAYQRQLM